MVLVKERPAKHRCLICGSEVEKSNLGNLCNPCKDKMYKYPFAASKAATKKAEEHKAARLTS